MLRSAEFFKDETLQGISRAIKHLHQMQAEAFSQKMDNFGITKNNPHFRSLLNHLDMGLSLGLEEPHKGYWPLVKKLCHKATIQMVESHEEAGNNISRGQIWLFLTFIESSLLGYLKMIKESKKLVKWFYKKYALLRDEERFEILEQLVVGLEMVNFVLDFSSPYLATGREPIFKPSEFYGTKFPTEKSGSFRSSASNSPKELHTSAVKPDVTITTPAAETSYGATPDLLCKTSGVLGAVPKKGSMKGERKFDGGSGDGLVTHLRSKKREPSKNRRIPRRSESSVNELEEDNYIPEFQDSLPITVVVPDDPDGLDTSLNRITSDTSISDETVYTNFLMEYKGSPVTQGTVRSAGHVDSLSLDQELKRGLSLKGKSEGTKEDNSDYDPSFVSPDDERVSDQLDRHDKNDVVHEEGTECEEHADKGEETGKSDLHDDDCDVFKKEKHDTHDCDDDDGFEERKEIISSSLHSEGAYRITYVSDDEDESEAHDYSRDKYRSASLDSFDRFCRSGSVGQDPKRKTYNDDDDDENLDKLRISPVMDTNEKAVNQTSNRDINLDPDAIASSPMSEKLSKESVDKILTARFDTTTGILLPTLPRRPDLTEACEMHQATSMEQNVLVLLSLEIFEKSTETFKKIFEVYIGYLFGLRKRVSLLITNECMYILTRQEKQEPGYQKELSLPLDSINRIQTGLNVQDVLLHHDNGTLHLWTGDEILTKNIILTLSSELKAGDVRSVSVEQMKVDTHGSLEFIIHNWLLFLENKKEPDIFHFALVEFHSITVQEPDQKVLKSGYLHHKQSYLGMVPYWELSIFGLRGSSLYEYSGKGSNELKHVYDLSKCGGCVRMKSADKPYSLRVLNKDGSTPLLELAAESEEEANDWIVNICQVVADTKHGKDTQMLPYSEGVSPRALLLTSEKLYLFIEDPKSGRLALVDSCTVQDITQICVDNQDRTYCVVLIDDSIDNYLETEKRTWILKFHSEYELGKFEQKIFAAWHLLYQVPLQFVLLADKDLKSMIQRHISVGRNESTSPIEESQSIATLASL